MANTEPMTQRVELATVRDRLAVDGLVTEYAVAVDDGDWEAYRGLFTPDGRADYRSAGGIEGSARAVAGWLADRLGGFPVRQHLIVNRRVRFGVWEQDTGDTAQVRTVPGPYLFGADEDLTPVLLSLRDMDGDGLDDLIVDVRNEQIVYLNRDGAFRLPTAEEQTRLVQEHGS